MRISSSCVGLALVLLASSCGGGADVAADDRALAALIPTHAVVYVRIASLDALTAPVQEVAGAAGQDAQQMAGKKVLAQLGGMAGDTQWIDSTRPFAIAVSSPKATPPTPMFFVPTTDPAKYAASLTANGLSPVIDGSYVVVPIGGKYEKPTAPSTFGDGLPAGLVSMRVDAEKVATNFGVVIGTALSAFKASIAGEMEKNGSGLDGEAIADLYVEAARTLLASTSRMEMRVDYRDGRAQLSGSLMAKAGSAMDGWSSAPVDLTPFAGRLSAKSSFELVLAADWAKLWPRMETMMSAMMEAYPAEVREPMRAMMAGYMKVYEGAGQVIVGDGDILGEGGMRLAMHMAPTDGKAFVAAIEAILARPELEQIGAKITSVVSNEVAGAMVREYLMKFDLSKMLGAQPAAAQEQLATMMHKVFPAEGMPMRIAVKGQHGVMTLGQPREDLASSFAAAKGSWSPVMQAAIAQVGDCNPMMIERIDMAATMDSMMQLMADAGGGSMPKVPAGASADFVFTAGIRGSEWRFGLGMDALGFAKMVKAMKTR